VTGLDLSQAVIVDFPLRGECVAINTPAQRVPSHGTDYFGQRYAYDFVQMDERGRFQRNGLARHLLRTLPVTEFYCWEQRVYSAFAGRVVSVGDWWPDRMRVNAFAELWRARFKAKDVEGSDFRPLLGNFVMIEGAPGVAVYAHLRSGSVSCQVGRDVAAGAQIGVIGNSGNSTMPHLHFHLMDRADPQRANGVLCAFRRLEHSVNGRWLLPDFLVPARLERVRGKGDVR
jgi:peptidase M23-like protein